MSKLDKEEKTEEVSSSEKKFTKEALLNSKKYKNRMPILRVLLVDGKEYSINETDKLIEKYMKSGVK